MACIKAGVRVSVLSMRAYPSGNLVINFVLHEVGGVDPEGHQVAICQAERRRGDMVQPLLLPQVVVPGREYTRLLNREHQLETCLKPPPRQLLTLANLPEQARTNWKLQVSSTFNLEASNKMLVGRGTKNVMCQRNENWKLEHNSIVPRR